VRDIREVRAYDIVPERRDAYAREMEEATGIRIIPVDTPRDAVAGCDMVVTAGPILKHPTPVIAPDWLSPGVLAVPLDFDSYFTPASTHAVDYFVTDDAAQYLYYRQTGYFGGCPDPHADLGEVVVGKKPARTDPSQQIMSMNLGLAIEDMAVAHAVYRRALDSGLGTALPL
jgi:ornithine cyclodeaminase/alanine dehydrogenase